MTGDNVQKDRPSMTKVVGYCFRSAKDLEEATDDLLQKELGRDGTPLTQYGTNGLDLWLNGSPGPKLREIVLQVRDLGWTSCKAIP